MKHITDNNDVTHLWAHQVQDWAKGHSVSFRGVVLKSYNAVIGHIYTNRTRGPAALVSSGSWSVTTNKHIGMAFRAVNGVMPIFTVPSLERERVWGEPDRKVRPDHKVNLAFYLAEIEDSVLKASRARVSTEWHIEAAERRVKEGNKYAQYFLLKTRFLLPTTDQIKEKLKAQRSVAQAKARADEKRREERLVRFENEELPKWRRGDGYLRFIPALAPTYLRIVGDTVESSTVATVPLSHVQKLMPLVHAIANGEKPPFVSNGRTLKVGNFKLNSIDSEGTVRIGCHTILYPEVVTLAAAINAMKSN